MNVKNNIIKCVFTVKNYVLFGTIVWFVLGIGELSRREGIARLIFSSVCFFIAFLGLCTFVLLLIRPKDRDLTNTADENSQTEK